MMQIIENWSEITGSIISAKKSPKLEGFFEIEIAIESIKEVKGFKNLLSDYKDKKIVVAMRCSNITQISPFLKKKIRFATRKANLTSYFMNEKTLKAI